MGEPLVSVIVPVYNMEEYLERSVESLKKQTYHNIEILLIDDGSLDKSLKVCKNLALQDERIRVYYSAMYRGEEENRNCGLETTRNCGLEKATGEWVMFLDSDDTFVPDAIEKMVLYASAHDADIVFSPFCEIVDGVVTVPKVQLSDGIYLQKEFVEHCISDIPFKVMSCIGSKIYRRSLIEEKKLRFDSYYKFNEDGAFMLSCLLCAKKVGFLNYPFYQYYIRQVGSIQSSYRENMFDLIMRTYILLKNLLVQNEVYEKKKHNFIYLMRELALNALINEARFRDYSDFKKLFEHIRKDEHYPIMQKKWSNASNGQKIMLLCMKMKLPRFFYRLLQVSVL